MNAHRKQSHQALPITNEDLNQHESCLATRSGPKKSYKDVATNEDQPLIEDFRSESMLEHRLGLLKFGCLFKEGEQAQKFDKSVFHVIGPDGMQNPYFEDVILFLEYAVQACNKGGSHLLRQQMLRNNEGLISANTFRCIQPVTLRQYAGNIAKLVFFSSKAAWDTKDHILTNVKTILHSLLFEPNVSISQTFMLR
jgi:hypothetical protein